jgi:hypothetical protein
VPIALQQEWDMNRRLPIFYALILMGETCVLGFRYLHDPPSSSDPLSINLGWGGLVSMVLLLIYSVARRSRSLRRFARLSYWLHFHIFLALQAVLLTLFHCYHLFVREAPLAILNPGFLCFVMVCVVFFSGLFGRYLYTLVPHTLGGVQMNTRDLQQELAGIDLPVLQEIDRLWKTDHTQPRGLFGIIEAHRKTRHLLGELAQMDLSPEVRILARRKVELERYRGNLQLAERVFRRWIVLHRPLAGLLYLFAVVHILLSYMFTPSLAG